MRVLAVSLAAAVVSIHLAGCAKESRCNFEDGEAATEQQRADCYQCLQEHIDDESFPTECEDADLVNAVCFTEYALKGPDESDALTAAFTECGSPDPPNFGDDNEGDHDFDPSAVDWSGFSDLTINSDTDAEPCATYDTITEFEDGVPTEEQVETLFSCMQCIGREADNLDFDDTCNFESGSSVFACGAFETMEEFFETDNFLPVVDCGYSNPFSEFENLEVDGDPNKNPCAAALPEDEEFDVWSKAQVQQFFSCKKCIVTVMNVQYDQQACDWTSFIKLSSCGLLQSFDDIDADDLGAALVTCTLSEDPS